MNRRNLIKNLSSLPILGLMPWGNLSTEKKVSPDVIEWAEKNYTIENGSLIKLNPSQKFFMEIVSCEYHTISANFKRREGSSTAVFLSAIHRALYKENENIMYACSGLFRKNFAACLWKNFQWDSNNSCWVNRHSNSKLYMWKVPALNPVPLSDALRGKNFTHLYLDNCGDIEHTRLYPFTKVQPHNYLPECNWAVSYTNAPYRSLLE